MDHPSWMFVPWLVFSAALALKLWKLGLLLNRQLQNSSWGIERFRAVLERDWQRTQSLR